MPSRPPASPQANARGANPFRPWPATAHGRWRLLGIGRPRPGSRRRASWRFPRSSPPRPPCRSHTGGFDDVFSCTPVPRTTFSHISRTTLSDPAGHPSPDVRTSMSPPLPPPLASQSPCSFHAAEHAHAPDKSLPSRPLLPPPPARSVAPCLSSSGGARLAPDRALRARTRFAGDAPTVRRSRARPRSRRLVSTHRSQPHPASQNAQQAGGRLGSCLPGRPSVHFHAVVVRPMIRPWRSQSVFRLTPSRSSSYPSHLAMRYNQAMFRG